MKQHYPTADVDEVTAPATLDGGPGTDTCKAKNTDTVTNCE